MGGGEDDEQLNNYDTGAGFFQVCSPNTFFFVFFVVFFVLFFFMARISQVPLHKYATLAKLIKN